MGIFDTIKDMFSVKTNSTDAVGPIQTGTDIASAIFMSSSPTYNSVQIADIISSASISYTLALNVGNTNTVISRFIDLVSSAITSFTIVDQKGIEVVGAMAEKIKDEVLNVYG